MITMKDIARKAGVSRPTVSFILNGRDKELKVAEKTSQRVRRIASEMGYYGDEIARSMVTGKTRVLAFLANNMEMEYVAKIMTGFLSEAVTSDYYVKPFTLDINAELGNDLEKLIKQRIAGVVYHGSNYGEFQRLKKVLTKQNIPLIALESEYISKNANFVFSDEEKGITQAIDHLHSFGHRRIAYISSVETGYSASRKKHYIKALEEKGINIEKDLICIASKGRKVVPQYKEMAGKLLKKKKDITAVFCASDYIAMIVLSTAHEMGVKIPEEFSVIGFANLYASSFTAPPLTTVEQNFPEIGKQAASLLIKTIENKNKYIVSKKIRSRLVVRKSTGPAPVKSES